MFRPSDYLFTPGDVADFYRFLHGKIAGATARDWRGVVLLMILILALALTTPLEPDAILLWAFFAMTCYWNLSPAVPIGFALAGLCIIPLFLAVANNGIIPPAELWAERVAVWVYFLLCMGVAKQVWEFRQNRRNNAGWLALHRSEATGAGWGFSAY